VRSDHDAPTVVHRVAGRYSTGNLRRRGGTVDHADEEGRAVVSRVRILYTNWRGETAWRVIEPRTLYFGGTQHHLGSQWLLKAFDVDKGEERDFAMLNIYRWELA
jgi:hypothetical protein